MHTFSQRLCLLTLLTSGPDELPFYEPVMFHSILCILEKMYPNVTTLTLKATVKKSVKFEKTVSN